ncbi:MAG: hypothetical protein KAT77_00420 [Nanoarchaeota archaeon]|nr:hypothetical protein [Nanoarchaeota archaeon]
MKKLISGLVLSGILGFGSIASAQEAPKEKGAVERLVDGLGDLISKGVDYASRKIMEKCLESEIEERFSYDLEDKRLERFVGGRGYEVFEDAEVTKFDDKKAVAVLGYEFKSPDTSKYRNFSLKMQREFSLKDDSIDKVIGEGKDWGVICGKKVSEDELDDILLLNKSIADRWDGKLKDYLKENKNHVVDYEIVFFTHENGVYKKGSVEKAKVRMPLRKSQVGIMVRIDDKFGNPVIEQRVVEGYLKGDEWQYSSQLYKRDMNGFDFTEKNHWQEKDFLKSLGESADKALRQGISYIKSLFKD